MNGGGNRGDENKILSNKMEALNRNDERKSSSRVLMWGYLPGISQQPSPLFLPSPMPFPYAGDSWKDVCGVDCGFAMAISGKFHKGMPHKFYHGRTGCMWNITKCAIGVEMNKQVGNRIIEKRIHVRVQHVQPSRCSEDFKLRVKKNDQLKAKAKARGEERYSVPSNFERILATNLKLLTENGQLLKVKHQYRIAPRSTSFIVRNGTAALLQGGVQKDFSDMERKGITIITKAQIDVDLDRIINMSAEEAAAVAAQVVAKAEAVVAEAEAAAKEAQEASQCFAEATEAALKTGNYRSVRVW